MRTSRTDLISREVKFAEIMEKQNINEKIIRDALVTMGKERETLKDLLKPKSTVTCEVQTDMIWHLVELEKKVVEQQKSQDTQREKDRREFTPALRGQDGEEQLLKLLVEEAPRNFNIISTRAVSHSGDFMILIREEGVVKGYAIIDCKSYSRTVPSKEVEKLEKDIDSCTQKFGSPPRWAAIISLHSAISLARSSHSLTFTHNSTRILLIGPAIQQEDGGKTSVKDMFKHVTSLPGFDCGRAATSKISRFETAQIKIKTPRVTFCDETKVEDSDETFSWEEPQISDEMGCDFDFRLFADVKIGSMLQYCVSNAISEKYEYSEDSKVKEQELIDLLELKDPDLELPLIKKILRKTFVEGLHKGEWIHNISLNKYHREMSAYLGL